MRNSESAKGRIGEKNCFAHSPTRPFAHSSRRSGQATTEMVFILPLLVMLAGGAIFIVYTCWQGIKAQQAANLAARVQGEEKVAGGVSLGDINQQNGSDVNGDPDPTLVPGKFTGQPSQAPPASVYGKLYNLAKQMFPSDVRSQVFVPQPQVGQNFDKIKVVRVINLPKLPFMTWTDNQAQIKLEGDAWGGEDTFMYGLPRWGSTSGASGQPEWQTLLQQTNSNNANANSFGSP